MLRFTNDGNITHESNSRTMFHTLLDNIINTLNELLANYQLFYQNLRGFHWNIQGKYFFELHVKFEELYTDSALKIDAVAERILTIGGMPMHSFEDYIKHAQIKAVTNVHDGEAAVTSLVKNLTTLVELQKKIKHSAEEINDGGTADMLSAFIEEQEKTIWMYTAWLK